MKADFNRKKTVSKRPEHSEGVSEGTYQDMLKMRKKQLPMFEESINEILEDYDGGMIAIIRIAEDKKGYPKGANVYIGGAAGMKSQVRLGKALNESSDELRDQLIEKCSGDTKALLALAKAVIEEAGDA